MHAKGRLTAICMLVLLALAAIIYVLPRKARSSPLDQVAVGQFAEIHGKVVESVQSGADFWLRVNITEGEFNIWRDTIAVKYHAVSPLQANSTINEGTIVSFWGWYRGYTAYKTVLGLSKTLPLFEACLLWERDGALRFAPPPGCRFGGG